MVLIYSRITNIHISFVHTCFFLSKMKCSIYTWNFIHVALWHHKVSNNRIRGFLRHCIYRDILLGFRVFRFCQNIIKFHYAVLRSLRLKCRLNCTVQSFIEQGFYISSQAVVFTLWQNLLRWSTVIAQIKILKNII